MFSSWTGRGATKRRYTACYLPDVMPAQGWTKLESIDSAIRKSGWEGRINDELRRSISLRRYQSKLVTVTWKDYVTWRTEQGGVMMQS
jgi:AMME syndrome candidate gene 1 protein